MSNEKNIVLSIVCLTYNHGQYIKDALDGFISQKTNFNYEVIVHDDCSTDNTAEIIKEYSEKYPEIIKPILQKENQYSKGIKIGPKYVYPKVKGKYIAICEGDDYWNDSNKIQKQIDFLEKNNNYVACVHNSIRLDCKSGKQKRISNITVEYDVSIEEIIRWGENHFQTASIMMRKEYFLIPAELKCGIGDYPRAINLALNGKIRYMPDVMSVYRFMSSETSWSARTNNECGMINNYTNINNMLKNLNKFTNEKYKDIIETTIRENEFRINLLKEEYKDLIKQYPEFVNKMKITEKLKLYIKAYMSWIYKIHKKIKAKSYK